MSSEIQTHEYKNGFRTIYEKPSNHLPLTSIICFVKFGSIYEPQEGIAHFIEHMCFKGTRKLENTKDIMRTYDGIGAYFNAFTTKEYTFYVIKCNENYISKCIHVLSDILMNSEFNRADYELEKHVIMEEMIRQENSPEFHIAKMKDKYLYSGSKFSRPIDDLLFHQAKNHLDYDTAVQMYDKYYKPHNMCLSITSNISFSSIKKMVSSSFFMKAANPFIANPSYQIDLQSKTEYNIQKKQGVKATHLSVSFRTCSYTDNDKHIIALLTHIIGGSMSSRMFSLLREKHGLTYTTSCYYTYYAHMGEITLQTMTDHTKVITNGDKPGVLPLVIHILKDLKKHGITQEELTFAKGFLKGKMAIKMENAEYQSEYNGLEHFIYGNSQFTPMEQLYKKYYEPITKQQVNNIITKYFKKETMVVCLFGEHVPTMNKVKEQCTIG
jgi:predicted Zn-dependent peptidase